MTHRDANTMDRTHREASHTHRLAVLCDGEPPSSSMALAVA